MTETPRSTVHGPRSTVIKVSERIAKMAFVALGANVGRTTETIMQAINTLQVLSDEPVLKSSLWVTSPVDCPPGSAPFVNAVIGLEPRADETPESLLIKLKQLERDFGRRAKTILNEPRVLDLDLIAFGASRRNSGELTLPH